MTGNGRLAIFYLVTATEAGHLDDVRRFVRAYGLVPAGIDHDLIVVFHGFASADELDRVRTALQPASYQEFHASGPAPGLQAYADAILATPCERACFLQADSEPVSSHWLLKLTRALDRPGVGLAVASASFETGAGGLAFPNVHVRPNAFILNTALAHRIMARNEAGTAPTLWAAECGAEGLTREVWRHGLAAVLVGANGRAYAPEWWIGSDTFRQGGQSNLLVRDGQSRQWDTMTWPERRATYEATWGATRKWNHVFGDPSG